MNSKNSKTSDIRSLILNFTEKIDLKRRGAYDALSNLSIYYTWKTTKSSYKNNGFRISTATWNNKLEVLDGSYSYSRLF